MICVICQLCGLCFVVLRRREFGLNRGGIDCRFSQMICSNLLFDPDGSITFSHCATEKCKMFPPCLIQISSLIVTRSTSSSHFAKKQHILCRGSNFLFDPDGSITFSHCATEKVFYTSFCSLLEKPLAKHSDFTIYEALNSLGQYF